MNIASSLGHCSLEKAKPNQILERFITSFTGIKCLPHMLTGVLSCYVLSYSPVQTSLRDWERVSEPHGETGKINYFPLSLDGEKVCALRRKTEVEETLSPCAGGCLKSEDLPRLC